MLADMDAWVDVPDDMGVLAREVEVDPSHEGREYFHFIDMAQDSFTRYRNAGDIIDLTNMNDPAPDAPPVANATLFEIYVLGTQGYDVAQSLPHDQCHDYINETLIMHGLLGTVPVHLTLAIPIMTLELYHRCQLHCLQFSIQQWVKVLCELSNFSDAFDTYLVILRQVDQAIKVQLNQNTGSCTDENKLARETELNPSVMGAIDGNNSLK
ncbi:hypothetical protein K439DRAFT_1662761, partial [Ramaria rubella]